MHGRTYLYSYAIIRAISDMRRAFRPILQLRVIPPFIRNPVYGFVAMHRKNRDNENPPLTYTEFQTDVLAIIQLSEE